MEGISNNTVKLISQSRRPGSIASYKSTWNQWTSLCVREKIDPFCAPLSKIFNYLPALYDEGLQYRTVNAHRSAISAYHNLVNWEPIVKHRKFLHNKGIFNGRPPQPWYTL